ncbi:MAG TPA: hypothetical protein PLA68_17605 [Panacibacter sp.]|nr:hypothetical protein [Panacibacter sp.]
MKSQINLLIKKATTVLSKKVSVAILAATFITATAFASGEESAIKAASSLQKEFKNARNIEWKVTPNYIKASFKWNDQDLQVFYSETGETIAVSRKINETNLPLKAQQIIQKKYADYTITEAIECTSEKSGVCYYVSLAKDGAAKQILQISTEGDISIFRP